MSLLQFCQKHSTCVVDLPRTGCFLCMGLSYHSPSVLGWSLFILPHTSHTGSILDHPASHGMAQFGSPRFTPTCLAFCRQLRLKIEWAGSPFLKDVLLSNGLAGVRTLKHWQKMWAISLPVKLWEIAWDIWDHRNQIMFNLEMTHQDLRIVTQSCMLCVLNIMCVLNMFLANLVFLNVTDVSSNTLMFYYFLVLCIIF